MVRRVRAAPGAWARLAFVLLTFLLASPAWAQEGRPPPPEPVEPNVSGALVGALSGNALGLVVGGFIGARVELAGGTTSEDPGLDGFVFGALVGTALLTPLLTHAFAGRRGNLMLDVLAVAAATGGLTALAARSDRGLVVLTIPLGQIVAAVVTEVTTAR